MSDSIWQAHRQKHPTTVEDLPSESFYAILRPESVTIPGDERSRTNPGHGYPEHSVDYWAMEVFPTREAWEAEIDKLSKRTGYGQVKFKAVKVTPAKIKTTITTEIEG